VRFDGGIVVVAWNPISTVVKQSMLGVASAPTV